MVSLNSNRVSSHNYTNSVFIYSNDTHGSLGALPHLVAGINSKQAELKNKNPITLSSGDDLMCINEVNPQLETQRREILVQLFNKAKFKFMALGNHETNTGLNRLTNLLAKADFKLISSNVKTKFTPLYEAEKKSKFVKSAVYINEDGEKYGILAASPLDEFSSEITGKTGDLIAGIPINYEGNSKEIKNALKNRYEATMNMIDAEIDKMEKQGINKIILLSHLGYEKDRSIAPNDKRINGVDIIIGGHSHDILEGFTYKSNGKKQNVFRTPEKKPIIIVQAGYNAERFGVLDVLFNNKGELLVDNNGKIKGHNTQFHSRKFPVPQKLKYEIDNTINNIFKNYPKIGYVKTAIRPIGSRDKENAIVTATCDAFLELANKEGTDDIKDLDFAMIQSSQVRGEIAPGELNEGKLSLVYAFAKPMAKVKAGEKQIVDTINHMLNMGNKKGKYDIPQFSSNIKYEINEQVDENDKKSLTLSKLTIKGKEINIQNPKTDKTYKIAIESMFAYTNYFGDSFYDKNNKKCSDKNGKPLNNIKGLADYLRKNNVDPLTKEITFDVMPKNITIKHLSDDLQVAFTGSKLSISA